MNKQNIIQFIKFGLVGVSNTIVNYLVYEICRIAFGLDIVVSNTLGFVISVLNAYFWGSRFVFKEDETKEKRVWWRVLLKTYASYALGFVLNTLLLILWVEIINIGQYFGFVGDFIGWLGGFLTFLPSEITAEKLSDLIAPILNMVVTIPINFILNKFWAYRQKSKKC